MTGLLAALAGELPEGASVTDPDVMGPCRRDRAETVVPGQPVAVVRATSVADVRAVLREASAFGVSVVPRGTGTGLSGGSSAERRQTAIPVIGHAGDGNLHPMVTFDRHDPDARAAVAFDDEVMEGALGLGGTVTGEHGVGSLLKARHLAEEVGPDVLRITEAVKAALDPLGILDAGKWV